MKASFKRVLNTLADTIPLKVSRPFMVCTREVDFEKGPKRSKWGTRRLREFCGSSVPACVGFSNALGFDLQRTSRERGY